MGFAAGARGQAPARCGAGAHAVQALGGSELGEVVRVHVQARMLGFALHGRHELLPRGLLLGGEFERFLELRGAFGKVLLAALLPVVHSLCARHVGSRACSA